MNMLFLHRPTTYQNNGTPDYNARVMYTRPLEFASEGPLDLHFYFLLGTAFVMLFHHKCLHSVSCLSQLVHATLAQRLAKHAVPEMPLQLVVVCKTTACDEKLKLKTKARASGVSVTTITPMSGCPSIYFLTTAISSIASFFDCYLSLKNARHFASSVITEAPFILNGEMFPHSW